MNFRGSQALTDMDEFWYGHSERLLGFSGGPLRNYCGGQRFDGLCSQTMGENQLNSDSKLGRLATLSTAA